MTRRLSIAGRCAAALALMAGATLALAAGPLHRLPADYAFPQGDGSPGKVTFSHTSHVDSKKPECLTCHPRTFRITESGKPVDREPIKHSRMDAGAACGACHGKAAFGFDSCDLCHKS